MILRRIRAHVEAENWFAVAVDFAIVVIGVFIGIQVANWNAERQLEDQRARMEARLVTDFAQLQQTLHDHIEGHENRVLNLYTLHATLERVADGETESVDPETDAAIRAALRNYGSFESPFLRSSTYAELVASGQLGLLDDALRTALARYDLRAQRIPHNFNNISAYMQMQSPHIDGKFELSSVSRDETGQIEIRRVADYDLTALSDDPDFRSAMDQVADYQTFFLLNFTNQQLELDLVLNALERAVPGAKFPDRENGP